MNQDKLIKNEIRRKIKEVDFKNILTKEFNIYDENIYDNFLKFEDVVLLPVFTTECFKIIDEVIGNSNEDIGDEESVEISSYIEDQKYYEDGDYLNIISELKSI